MKRDIEDGEDSCCHKETNVSIKLKNIDIDWGTNQTNEYTAEPTRNERKE